VAGIDNILARTVAARAPESAHTKRSVDMRVLACSLALVTMLGCMPEIEDGDDLGVAFSLDGLPRPGSIAAPIEGFAAYDSSIDSPGPCGGQVMRPGVRAFSDHVKRFGIVANTYVACEGFHARGQALDVWIYGHAAKQAFADWLTANDSEMARRLGLVQIIWNHQMWRSYHAGSNRPRGAFGHYGGSHPHTDHLHLSFGEDGARGATSFFTTVLGEDGGISTGSGFAFQANTTELWTEAGPTGFGMLPGTSPAIASGNLVAFQANTGRLWIVGPSAGGDTQLGMMHGTSPALARVAAGHVAAFHANTGELWIAGATGTGSTGLGMMPGTSPSLTTLAGAPLIAFQANTGRLWLAGAHVGDQQLGMAPDTNPSITALPGGGHQIAFQANTGELWIAGTAGTGSAGLGMMPGTSPSITALAGGGYQIALQANTGELWVWGTAGTGPTGLGMMPGTSPTISARGAGYEILFQANTGELWRAGSTIAPASLGLGMAQGTSPAS
jgi:hypothetical protein